MWFLVSSTAFAVAPGHWHPTDLAPLSTRFHDSSAKLQEVLADREGTAKTLAAALLEYEESLDLLGSRAPAAERARCDELQEGFKDHREALQTFANKLVEDYDAAFRRSVARAAGGTYAELQECEAEIERGALPGMPGQKTPNMACEGPNLNQTFATAVDADPELARDLDELLARPWPQTTIEQEPQAVIDGTSWLLVREVVQGVAGETLSGIETSDGLSRLDLANRAVEATGQADMDVLHAELAQLEAETTASRAALGEPILAAAEAVLAKKSAETGWCANPRTLGACVGPDAGRDVLAAVTSNKKVQKAGQISR
jgi:hypothetical protein